MFTEKASSDHNAGPVTPGERINSLDVLRGFALLGILVLNIESFSGPQSLHDIPLGTAQPAFQGWHAGLDVMQLVIKWLFFEGKMRALFAMLYGAGIVLLTERFERRGDPGRAADIFCRRNLWLLLFGILHGTLIWDGDILVTYSLVALLFMFPLRHLSARRLILTGLAIGLVGGTIGAIRFFGVPGVLAQEHLRLEGQMALQAHLVPSAEQKTALDAAAKELRESAQEAESEVRNARRPYLETVGPRAVGYAGFVSWVIQSGIFLEVMGNMLLGMGLFKCGFLTGRQSAHTYVVTAAVGYAISTPLVLGGIDLFARDGFSKVAAARWLYCPYEVEVCAAAVANAAVVLLILRRGWFQPATALLAKVGRMAFTNYIATSVLCQWLFCWGPLQLFGRIAYHQQLWVIAGVWVVNVVVSAVWLRFFAYGPLEWVWRSLVHWQRQPLRLGAAVESAARIGL